MRAALIIFGIIALVWAVIKWFAADLTKSPSMKAEIARSYRRWAVVGGALLAAGLAWPLILETLQIGDAS